MTNSNSVFKENTQTILKKAVAIGILGGALWGTAFAADQASTVVPVTAAIPPAVQNVSSIEPHTTATTAPATVAVAPNAQQDPTFYDRLMATHKHAQSQTEANAAIFLAPRTPTPNAVAPNTTQHPVNVAPNTTAYHAHANVAPNEAPQLPPRMHTPRNQEDVTKTGTNPEDFKHDGAKPEGFKHDGTKPEGFKHDGEHHKHHKTMKSHVDPNHPEDDSNGNPGNHPDFPNNEERPDNR